MTPDRTRPLGHDAVPAPRGTAFVTGGAGFIGSHVTDRLLTDGWKVTVYDDLSTGRREFVDPRARIEVGDIADLDRMTEHMAGADAVFHFAANADVRGGRSDTFIDLERNTVATHRVLEAARRNAVPRFVFASSAVVYGEPDVFPTPECTAATQTSLYGASKLAGEAMIEAYAEYFDMTTFSFRFVSWVGERYSHGVVFDFMKKLRTDPRQLEILGDGTQRKSYLYVKDGVEGIMRAFHDSTERKNLFNLGHDHWMPVTEVARIVCDEMGLRDVAYRFTGGSRGWVGDSPFVHLDTSRVKRLGWSARTDIEEGLRRTVRFLLAHPHLLETRR
jgi:UDP-glucose 4-epimerase